MTNVDADPKDVDIGTRVEVRFVDTEDEDVSIPVFIPIEA